MRLIALSAFLVVLGGCSFVPGLTQLEGAFVVGTDKTIEDHIISWSSGKNCSFIRTEKDMTYCEEDEIQIKQNIYCYKTLARVTCYDRPDPNPGRRRVDRNDHNRAQ